MLYSAYSLPNIVLPAVAGVIFDRIGARVGLTLVTILVVTGQGLFAIGAGSKSFNTMLLGRAIFGIGCEATYISSFVLLVEWFENYEMSFAMGAQETLPLLASYLAGAVVPSLYVAKGI
jgi:MFS family permease